MWLPILERTKSPPKRYPSAGVEEVYEARLAVNEEVGGSDGPEHIGRDGKITPNMESGPEEILMSTIFTTSTIIIIWDYRTTIQRQATSHILPMILDVRMGGHIGMIPRFTSPQKNVSRF